MKKLFIAAVLLSLSLSMTACGAKDPVSSALNIDASRGSEVSRYDTHSGNGDGVSCVILSFGENPILDQLRDNAEWKPFPLDETAQALVYGVTDGASRTGPFLTDAKTGEPLVPEIQNGYYTLIDRHRETDTELLHRNSFNFTMGLYDADTNTLYFCEMDT